MALTLKFEVAFNAGYATPAASRTWTDITSYVVLSEGVDITFGRRDELSTTEPNTLNLTLDNRDGRFTPERAGSPYYPDVKLFRPIRVTATLPDASESVRFLGYVTEWPTGWPDGTDAYSAVALTAVSRMARLGDPAQLRSMLEQEYLAVAPSAYYPMGEAAGSISASDISGNNAASLTALGSGTAVAFGADGAPAGGLAAQFAGGQYLSAAVPGIVACEVWAQIPSAPAAQQVIASIGSLATLVVETSGVVSVYFGFGGSSPILGPQTNDHGPLLSMADGAWHQFIFRYSSAGGTVGLAFDGGSLANDSGGGAIPTGRGSGSTLTVGAGIAGVSPFTGLVAHVATSSAVLANSTTRYQVGTGTLSETTAARLERLAACGGVAAAEVSAGGTVTVQAQDIGGRAVLDAMRDIEATEGGAGVLYDERDGTLTLSARNARYDATPAFTLDASSEQVGADFAPTYDGAKLLNDVTFTGPFTTARYFTQSSIDDYGTASSSGTTLASDVDEPFAQAAWRVNAYSEPRTRVPTLTADVLPLGTGTPSVMDVAAATVGTLIKVDNLPAQAASSSASYFAEGYTERFGLESWEITFNVSPSAPHTNVWQLGSATRSQLGTTTLLAL